MKSFLGGVMFGNQNDQKQEENQIPDQAIDDVVNNDAAQPATVTPVDQPWQHPSVPPLVADAAGHGKTVQPTADGSSPSPAVAAAAASLGSPGHASDDSSSPHELIDIKQQALSQLSPLVGHLDQTPEEKFRTMMMMIQASDDQTLLKSAYEAAGKIEDEKVRAQALLDIINEINYFTQHHPAQAQPEA